MIKQTDERFVDICKRHGMFLNSSNPHYILSDIPPDDQKPCVVPSSSDLRAHRTAPRRLSARLLSIEHLGNHKI